VLCLGLWLLGLSCADKRVSEFVTADEDAAIGLGGGLDASLDRISSKLQQEKMNRLLTLDDTDSVSGLTALLKDDAVTKDAVKTVRSVTPEEPPRLKQVVQTDSALKALKDEVSAVLTQQASILAKQESVQKELSEIRTTLNKRDTSDHEAAIRLDKIKNDIINGVSQTIEQSKQEGWQSSSVPPASDNNRFQQQERVDDTMRRSVLTALKRTLADLKAHVIGRTNQPDNRAPTYQYARQPYDNQPPRWQQQQFYDGNFGSSSTGQQVSQMQDYDQTQPMYSDQTVGSYIPDYSN